MKPGMTAWKSRLRRLFRRAARGRDCIHCTIRPVFGPKFDLLRAAIDGALELQLELPEGALDRLLHLCQPVRNRIVYGDARLTSGAGECDLSIGLNLSVADAMFLAALGARDLAAVHAHFEYPSVEASTASTVSAGGVGVTTDPAIAGAP